MIDKQVLDLKNKLISHLEGIEPTVLGALSSILDPLQRALNDLLGRKYEQEVSGEGFKRSFYNRNQQPHNQADTLSALNQISTTLDTLTSIKLLLDLALSTMRSDTQSTVEPNLDKDLNDLNSLILFLSDLREDGAEDEPGLMTVTLGSCNYSQDNDQCLECNDCKDRMKKDIALEYEKEKGLYNDLPLAPGGLTVNDMLEVFLDEETNEIEDRGNSIDFRIALLQRIKEADARKLDFIKREKEKLGKST